MAEFCGSTVVVLAPDKESVVRAPCPLEAEPGTDRCAWHPRPS